MFNPTSRIAAPYHHQVKAFAWALVLLVFLVLPAAAACPVTPPTQAFGLSSTCGSAAACANGPLTLLLEPRPSGFFPPTEYDPGYSIQSCDTVTWSFGDGTTETVIGLNQVVHEYPVPGNYTIDVTVTNSLGAVTVNVARSLVVASAPARVSFVTPGAPFPWSCPTCVLAREDAGSVTIDVVRSLDLTRTISVTVNINGAAVSVSTIPKVSENLIFGPNESRKTLTIPITNDQVYYGPRYYPLEFANPTGGLLADANAVPWPALLIVDDDPQPILSLDSAISLREGNVGLTPFSIPVHLSAPMAIDVTAAVSFENGTATLDDFVPGSGGLRIRAGETEGVISGSVKGDVTPEADETFTIRLIPLNTNNDPAFGNVTAVVTIVNDDSATATPIPTLSSLILFVLGLVLLTVALRAIG